MQLIADSGGTKTDWAWLAGNLPAASGPVLRTGGINPGIQAFAQIRRLLVEELLPAAQQQPTPVGISFYGASFALPHQCSQMEALLSELLAAPAQVWHDILGAARALAGHQPALVCILGTGSNSCYYDGQEISQTIGGHGYVLGDEGGGVDLGRRLLQHLLRREASPALLEAFMQAYPDGLMAQREALYAAPKLNTALASYAPFLLAQLAVPQLQAEVQALVQASFRAFIRYTLQQYPAALHTLPVHTVGSVGFHFQALWRTSLQQAGFRPGQVLASPMPGLLQYHHLHPFPPLIK
ncbi:MAG: ATPase [Sphingobacteriia bacterium]